MIGAVDLTIAMDSAVRGGALMLLGEEAVGQLLNYVVRSFQARRWVFQACVLPKHIYFGRNPRSPELPNLTGDSTEHEQLGRSGCCIEVTARFSSLGDPYADMEDDCIKLQLGM